MPVVGAGEFISAEKIPADGDDINKFAQVVNVSTDTEGCEAKHDGVLVTIPSG